MKHLTTQLALLALILTSLTACQQECGSDTPQTLSEEYYSGGKLGTTFNNTSSCFEQPTEAIALAGLDATSSRASVVLRRRMLLAMCPV